MVRLCPMIVRSSHGCGSAFPVPENTDSAVEHTSEQRNRRVEFFFFDELIGVQPEPPGDTSGEGAEEYPTWAARAEIEDLTTAAALKEVTFAEMHDALFRTNSCVLLPVGEDPREQPDGNLVLTTVGLVAGVLRFNQMYPGKKLVVAGHCDTMGTVAFNQDLSEERAKVTLACLTGDRDSFAALCNKRHDDVDLTQIFDWTADSFGFTCKPTVRDRPPSTTTIQRFKESYNEHFDEMFADMPGAQRFASVTGTVNQNLWQAIFDCYEFSLRGELEETESGVASLRGLLTWVDPDRQALGFSEYFPVDNLTRDQYRSQANRRVEVLLFDPGEEPDLVAAQVHPELAEMYMPGIYSRQHISLSSAGPDSAWVAEGDLVDFEVAQGGPRLSPTTPSHLEIRARRIQRLSQALAKNEAAHLWQRRRGNWITAWLSWSWARRSPSSSAHRTTLPARRPAPSSLSRIPTMPKIRAPA